MTQPLLTRRQVVERLNVSPDWFSRNRRKLEEAGFPCPLPGFGSHQAARWSAEAIDAWIAANAGGPPEPPPPAPVEALQDRLRQRALRIAHREQARRTGT